MVIAATWAFTAWLLGQATAADSAARIEAVRTGLTAGAGVGAAVALLLSFRRQRHYELATIATENDAAERRITELYTKAVDQLGSERTAVRLGGLYALERLAQDNPKHRQTIVNVICAYLRMPFTPILAAPDSAAGPHEATEVAAIPSPPGVVRPEPDEELPDEELQVRSAAQRIITDHLRDDRPPPQPASAPPSARYWHGMRVDLAGATLIDLDFARCHSPQITDQPHQQITDQPHQQITDQPHQRRLLRHRSFR